MKKYLHLIAAALLLSLTTGCTSQIEKPVQTDRIDNAPEVPKNLQTKVGEAEVFISWQVSNPSEVSQYLIYRGDTTKAETALLDSTVEQSYTDSNLRDGLRYVYQVSVVGKNNLEGKKSSAVSAIPNIFSISIADGALYTRSVDVSVNLTASSNTRVAMLGNDSSFAGSDWFGYSATRSWKLEPGEGVKQVYAKFRDSEGNETSRILTDDITLDSRAAIVSVAQNSNGRVLRAGDVVHFAVDGGELGGTATVDITTLGTISLYDDYAAVPPGSADGVYEADFTIPGNVDVSEGTVTGNFTDAAGNKATTRVAQTLINVANPPQASVLTSYGVSETEIELDWTKSNATDFASYLIFRSTSASVDSTATLVKTETIITNNTFRDTDLKSAVTYYYALYTTDKSGLMARSNRVQVATLSVPPAPVTLTAFIASESEIELSWTKSTAADFASYEVFRSDSATVTTSSTLLQTQTIVTTTTFRDTDRKPSTDYYYAVFTLDKAGQSSKSNVIKATTFANLNPKPVSLFITKKDSSSVTLGWTKNDDKDFESYRIFRSLTTPVDINGTGGLTGVVAAQATTSYQDLNITKGTKYYFVVVVYDKYGAASTASNEVFGPN